MFVFGRIRYILFFLISFIFSIFFFNPAYALPCGADINKKIDLQITCQQTGAQDRRYYIKIINRRNSQVDFNSLNLFFKLWVYEPQLRCISVCGQNGEVYNSSGARIGNIIIRGNTKYNFVSTPLFIENDSHKSNQEGVVPLIYTGGEVSYIPAGGWVQGFQILISSVCDSFAGVNDINQYFFTEEVIDSNKIISDMVWTIKPGDILASLSAFMVGAGNWENFNDDYSGLPLGQNSCNGNMAGPYYDDHHFALFFGDVLIGETKANGSLDPETGVPPGLGPCTATATKTVAASFTRTRTRTPTFTRTFTCTKTPTRTPTYSMTKTMTFTRTYTLTCTMTVTKTTTETITSTITVTPLQIHQHLY